VNESGADQLFRLVSPGKVLVRVTVEAGFPTLVNQVELQSVEWHNSFDFFVLHDTQYLLHAQSVLVRNS
jgi:hypothetical protein